MPDSRPSADDHARHDPLLVARHVAGDELPDAERAMAAALVSGCAACASLAADLELIPHLVASERTPPRRRDFRLTPEQADELRGSWLERAVRRLTLPQAAPLRPLAAAVMSLGLVLVGVGSVVPPTIPTVPTGLGDGAPAALEASPRAQTPATMAAPAPGAEGLELEAAADDAALEERVAEDGPGGGELERARREGEPDAALGDAGADPEDATEPRAMEAAEDRAIEASDTAAMEASDTAVEEPGAAALQAEATAMEAEVTAMPPAGTAMPAEAGAEPPGTADDRLAAEDAAAPPATVAGDRTGGSILVALGALLAIGGLLVLVAATLARRLTADPLLR